MASSVGSELVRRLKHFAEDLKETEDVSKRFTCRTVKLNLRPEPYDAEAVKKTRQKLNASQAVFAQFLGVSRSSVRDWEQGLKTPRGSSCRMLDEINRNPEYYRTRLRELASSVEAK